MTPHEANQQAAEFMSQALRRSGMAEVAEKFDAARRSDERNREELLCDLTLTRAQLANERAEVLRLRIKLTETIKDVLDTLQSLGTR